MFKRKDSTSKEKLPTWEELFTWGCFQRIPSNVRELTLVRGLYQHAASAVYPASKELLINETVVVKYADSVKKCRFRNDLISFCRDFFPIW